MIAMYAAIVMGWKITAREANWRCCAIESATSLRAATLSASEVRVVVVRGGTSARGLEAREVSSSALEVMVASEEGCNGGSVPEDDGSRRGVDVVEFSVEGARTRFARRKEKKAALVLNPGTAFNLSLTVLIVCPVRRSSSLMSTCLGIVWPKEARAD